MVLIQEAPKCPPGELLSGAAQEEAPPSSQFCLPPSDKEPFEDEESISLMRLELRTKDVIECFKMHD